MSFTKSPQHFSIVLLNDPVPLDKVSVDNIRKNGVFEVVTSLGNEALLLESPIKKIKANFQIIRLEFTDENSSDFDKRTFSDFESLLNLLPPLMVKAVGVNLFARLDFADNFDVSQLISDSFLKDREKFEAKLKSKVISTSVRVFYGESTNDHYDLRLTPVDLKASKLYIQLHRHKDIVITDQIRQIAETRKLFEETRLELNKTLKEIFGEG